MTYTPPNLREIKNPLGVSKYYRLQTILPIGYPNDEKPKYERKALEDVTSLEKF